MKNLIFDLDGVLSDSWDGINRAFAEIGFFGKSLDDVIKHQAEYASKKPYHAKGSNVSSDRISKISQVMEEAFGIMMRDGTNKMFGGFVDEILKISNARIALVSSNGKSHVRHFVRISKLPFTHSLSFEDSISKEEKIEWITRDWVVDVNQIIYVTDTLADIYELEAFMPKKNIIGVAWGYCGFDALAKELPKEQILKEFKDIHKLL